MHRVSSFVAPHFSPPMGRESVAGGESRQDLLNPSSSGGRRRAISSSNAIDGAGVPAYGEGNVEADTDN